MPSVSVDGKRTFLADIGEGRPLACVHGGLGSDHQVFLPWLEPLADRYRLLLVDVLGNGRSDDPDDWAAVDLGTFAAQLDGLRRELGIERWSVLGHSFGGMIVQEYALRHQADVDALVVVTSGSRVDAFEERWEIAARHCDPETLALMRSGLLREMPDDATYERVWQQVAPAYWVDPANLARMRPRHRYASRAFNAAVRLLPEIDLTGRLGELRVPTLVVGASEDWSFPPKVGPRVTHALIPGADYVELERSGHFPFVEEQERFLAEVGGWLDRTLGAARD
jgi:proline iminopeptidase